VPQADGRRVSAWCAKQQQKSNWETLKREMNERGTEGESKDKMTLLLRKAFSFAYLSSSLFFSLTHSRQQHPLRQHYFTSLSLAADGTFAYVIRHRTYAAAAIFGKLEKL
jgi:hypothetical protein